MSIEYNLANKVKLNGDTIIAKGDSGATSHYWWDIDRACLQNIEDLQGPTVTLPDNSTISSTEQGQLPLHSSLSNKALMISIVPGLQSSYFILLGRLCEDDCDVLLNKISLFVVIYDELMMEGFRNKGG